VKAFAIGFPKAGTMTLQTAFTKSGLKSAHWRVPGRGFVGDMIYDAWFHGEDPLAALRDFDAVTQADVCLPVRQLNLWPNLDFALLAAIREFHPDCLFILNRRASGEIAASLERWRDYKERIVASDIPGLPAGYGATSEELCRWIDSHYAAARRFFEADPRFLDLNVAADDAPATLGRELGLEIEWWGRANAGPPTEKQLEDFDRIVAEEPSARALREAAAGQPQSVSG
jgi:hypothetical protein